MLHRVFREARPIAFIHFAGLLASRLEQAALARIGRRSTEAVRDRAPNPPTGEASLPGPSELEQDPSGSSEIAVDPDGSKELDGAEEVTSASPPPAAAAAAAVGVLLPAAAAAAGAQQGQHAEVVRGAADRRSAEKHHAAILSIPGSHVDGRDGKRDHLSEGKFAMTIRNSTCAPLDSSPLQVTLRPIPWASSRRRLLSERRHAHSVSGTPMPVMRPQALNSGCRLASAPGSQVPPVSSRQISSTLNRVTAIAMTARRTCSSTWSEKEDQPRVLPRCWRSLRLHVGVCRP